MPSIDWPVVRHYDQAHLDRISLPVGGIGTGSIGLGGRGDLRDFEVGNRPGKGFRPDWAFFAIRARPEGAAPVALAVEGPVPLTGYEGAFGSPAPHHGLPRFARCSFDASYPFGRVDLADDDFPIRVELLGFNPLVLTDVASSSIPVAVFRHRLTNVTEVPTAATVALSMSNFVGSNGTGNEVGGNTNSVRSGEGISGVTLTAPSLATDAEAAGEVSLAVVTGAGVAVTHRTGWDDRRWGHPILDFWDDLLADGRLDDRASSADRPIASLAAEVTVPPGGSVELTFMITWNFPNRRAWRSEDHGGINVGEYSDAVIGNAYSVAYPDSWQTATDLVSRLDDLEQATAATVAAVADTDAPAELIEAALFNLSTLRSPTVFQSADGEYYGWEGVGDRTGSCYGTCTHVWGYEFATSLLFAPIARSFRRTQFARCTDDDGLMSFRAGLPADRSRSWHLAAADGQMACLVHLYLDWKLTGDDELLAALWPAARRALEFCWIEGGWDADRDGVMEGVQHNTMDVEYYGPNPQMGSWYLAALRACGEMARARGEAEFGSYCDKLCAAGSAWLDEELFNGEYYRHEVRGVADPATIADGLRHQSMGAADTTDPDLQLADGCLVDQLVGQYAAGLAGLGDLLDPDHVQRALRSVHRRNFRRSFTHHFNHMRSFVLGDEAAVLMCTYDVDQRPTRPFPYFSEVMTGFEYTVATGLLQVGAVEEGLEIIRAIRDRYDGDRRNPFDEAECGHHYARAMASWSAFATWNDLRYDGRQRELTIGDTPHRGRRFWSTGTAFGTWQPSDDDTAQGTLRVIHGELWLDDLVLAGERHRSPASVLTPETPWTVGSHVHR
ncbi:MAG TPA: GH116 family glycosyl-hydrolase [Microlunatus sp.]|nr:GH116 family glycosyl-hydrolase [Microlunatus sp.]